MNLFFKRKAPAMDEPETTGTQAIRARVWSRWKRAHLAGLARDLQIPLPQLESFAQGGQLPEAALHALTKEFFMNARFDAEKDKLIDTRPPPKMACTVMSPPYDPKSDPRYVPFDPNQSMIRLRPMTPEPEKPNPFKRPGFA
jgi:hypothetical protein